MFIQHITNHLQAWFDFPNTKIFCQVSTTNHNTPHIRTMALYDLTEEGTLVFFTETHTQKWLDLKQNARVAICMLNADYGQIVIEGEAQLKSAANDLPLTTWYWEKHLNDYWRIFYSAKENSPNPGKVPLSFGVIMVVPDAWEILEINHSDFLQGTRRKLQQHGNEWVKDELPLA